VVFAHHDFIIASYFIDFIIFLISAFAFSCHQTSSNFTGFFSSTSIFQNFSKVSLEILSSLSIQES
jgi:hypothetical protein